MQNDLKTCPNYKGGSLDTGWSENCVQSSSSANWWLSSSNSSNNFRYVNNNGSNNNGNANNTNGVCVRSSQERQSKLCAEISDWKGEGDHHGCRLKVCTNKRLIRSWRTLLAWPQTWQREEVTDKHVMALRNCKNSLPAKKRNCKPGFICRCISFMHLLCVSFRAVCCTIRLLIFFIRIEFKVQTLLFIQWTC